MSEQQIASVARCLAGEMETFIEKMFLAINLDYLRKGKQFLKTSPHLARHWQCGKMWSRAYREQLRAQISLTPSRRTKRARMDIERNNRWERLIKSALAPKNPVPCCARVRARLCSSEWMCVCFCGGNEGGKMGPERMHALLCRTEQAKANPTRSPDGVYPGPKICWRAKSLSRWF